LVLPPQGCPDVELWHIAICRLSSLDSPFKRPWKHSRHEAPASRSASFGVYGWEVSRTQSERATEREEEPRIRGRPADSVRGWWPDGARENQEKRTATMVRGEGVAVDRRKGAKKSDQAGVEDGELVKEFPARKP
jgi:hypothetical protein